MIYMHELLEGTMQQYHEERIIRTYAGPLKARKRMIISAC